MNPKQNPELAAYLEGISLSGNLRDDMVTLLERHGCAKIAGHCLRVGAEARRLAQNYAADEAQAEVAGWFHDISAILPDEQRAGLAERLGVEVLPEERRFPMILHQKLSACVAEGLFEITTPAILSAIACHTTLKPGASRLDKIVFLADKIAWDQPGEPPYLAELLQALGASLDQATFVYLDYLWQRRETLAVIHPWLAAAYQELSTKR